MNQARKFRVKIAFMVLILCLLPLLTGCLGGEEVNQLSIISGAAFSKTTAGTELEDKGENPEKKAKSNPDAYHIICEFISINTESVDEDSAPATVDTSGTTLSQALERLQNQDSRIPYWSHAKIIAVNKELARSDGLQPVLDFALRSNEIRLTTQFLLYDSEYTPNIFELKTNSSNIKAFDFGELLDTGIKKSTLIDCETIDLINLLSMEGIEAAIPIIGGFGEEMSAGIQGTGIFRGTRYVGEIDENETKILLMLKDNYDKGPYTVGDYGFNIRSCETTVTSSIVNDTPVFDTHIDVVAELSQDTFNVADTSANEIINILESSIVNQANSLISRAQNEFKSDFFGYGNRFKKSSNAPLPPWSEMFLKATINVTCNAKLTIGELKGY